MTRPLTPRARLGDRLQTKEDFERVMSMGRRIPCGRLALYAAPGRAAQTRTGFLCGRRVGGAVARNRARRLLREAWRMVGPEAKGLYDLVFVARPGTGGARANDIEADMRRGLRMAGVIAG